LARPATPDEDNLQKFFDDAVAMIAEILDVELVKVLELVPGDAECCCAPDRVERWYRRHRYVSTGRETHAVVRTAPAAGGREFRYRTRFMVDSVLRDHAFQAAYHDATATAAPMGCSAHTTSRRKFNEAEVSFLVAVANGRARSSGCNWISANS
jgi:hypothetical protein